MYNGAEQRILGCPRCRLFASQRQYKQQAKPTKNNGTILCDDYNLGHAPGVKNAIDNFVSKNNLSCSILFNERFAKIEKF